MTREFQVIIDVPRCKGCELCIIVCPQRHLIRSTRLNAGGNHFPEIVTAHACSGCLQCAIICPDAAIEIERHDPKTNSVTGRPRPHDGQ